MDELEDLTEALDALDDAIDQGPEPVARSEIAVPESTTNYTAPWDRQPEDKTDFWWLLFEHFRDSGVGRSMPDTTDWYNDMGGTPVKTSITVQGLRLQSTKARWVERASAWDIEQERLYQIARAEKIREMVERHGDQIEEALDGLMTPIRALLHRIESDPDFIAKLSETSASKLIGLANAASRTMPNLMSAERLARDMPTTIVGGTVQHNIEMVEVDHIGEVLAVLAGAGILDGPGNAFSVGEIVDAEVVEVHSLSAKGDERTHDSGDQS